MTNFSIGQKLIVKKDHPEGYCKDKGCVKMLGRMAIWQGKVVTIDEITLDGDYLIEEDDNLMKYTFSPCMFEKPKKFAPIKKIEKKVPLKFPNSSKKYLKKIINDFSNPPTERKGKIEKLEKVDFGKIGKGFDKYWINYVVELARAVNELIDAFNNKK